MHSRKQAALTYGTVRMDAGPHTGTHALKHERRYSCTHARPQRQACIHAVHPSTNARMRASTFALKRARPSAEHTHIGTHAPTYWHADLEAGAYARTRARWYERTHTGAQILTSSKFTSVCPFSVMNVNDAHRLARIHANTRTCTLFFKQVY